MTSHRADNASTSRAAIDDGDVQLYHGDVIDVLRSLPAGTVQTCVTSPPYWGLRDYGTGDGQIGLEALPDLYVERMVTVFREVWRVLRDDGTLWLNLGDSYAGSPRGNAPEDWSSSGLTGVQTSEKYRETLANGTAQRTMSTVVGDLKPKDLVGIPWRVAFALQTDGWYLRSDIIWNKPNPMPESVTDRPTKAHEYLFLLTKQPRYFYDADAIREPAEWAVWGGRDEQKYADAPSSARISRPESKASLQARRELGRNRRSVWTIATEPFPEAHFATYPQELVRPCILAGTSERGECSECGAPWQRQVERTPTEPVYVTGKNVHNADRNDKGRTQFLGGGVDTLGWRPSCSCVTHELIDAETRVAIQPGTRPQTVLDPFIGSGTTALVARKHGRRCIGIDLSADYLAIAARRLQQLSLFADPVGRSEDTLPEEVA